MKDNFKIIWREIMKLKKNLKYGASALALALLLSACSGDNAQEAKEESTKALYRQYAEEAVKFDRWTVAYENDGLSTSIYHELGHVVADQYFGMLNGKRFLVDGKAKISPERGQEIIRQAYRECKSNGEIYKISKYGAENVHEFFAESFAMYIAEEEELPSTVARMFKELKL